MKKFLLLTTAICACAMSATFAQTNLDLEAWAPNGFGGDDPTGWGTTNGFMALLAPQSVFKNTTTPGQGLASAKLTSVYWSSATTYGSPSDTAGGMLSIGGPVGFGPLGIPYTQKPVSVDFIYKANPLDSDFGVLIVQLQHRDTISGAVVVDGQGNMVFKSQVTTWKAGSVCVSYFTADTPDTLKIMAASSAIMVGLAPRGLERPGSELELDDFVINLPGALSATITGLINVDCKGNCTGVVSITPSGTTPYTYSWSNGDTTATAGNLCAGIVYSVFVTDSVGDKACLSAMVTEPATALTATTSSTGETGCGANDGTAEAAASGGTGPYNYSWNTTPTQTDSTATGLAPGDYIVTVTDNNGCTFGDTVTIAPAFSSLTATTSSTNETVAGANDGTASVSASGGTPPYVYSWNTTPAQTTASIAGLAPGDYIVTVTDSNLCISKDTVNVAAGPSGIKDIYGNSNIRIYPVPAVNELNIATAFNGNASFDIFNVIGKQVKSVAIRGDITKVSTSELSEGIYLYQIIDAQGAVLSKGKFNIVR